MRLVTSSGKQCGNLNITFSFGILLHEFLLFLGSKAIAILYK